MGHERSGALAEVQGALDMSDAEAWEESRNLVDEGRIALRAITASANLRPETALHALDPLRQYPDGADEGQQIGPYVMEGVTQEGEAYMLSRGVALWSPEADFPAEEGAGE